jgi:hypothetical protein
MLLRIGLAALLLSFLFMSVPAPSGAASVQLNALAGFNDSTPATPVGGNSGTTVGEQRLIAFQYAADLWAARLVSTIRITIDAAFSSLSCTANSGTLGQAGPITASANVGGLPRSNTFYAAAAANALTGSDLAPSFSDIDAEFNAYMGKPGCIEVAQWYYGLDGAATGIEIDFVSVLLHELGHGLGFLTFVNGTTGQKFSGLDDAYMVNLEDHSRGLAWPNMSDGQRVTSAVDGTQASSDLHWTGTAVNTEAAIPGFVAGLDAGVGAGGHVEMYAPNPFEGGSSVSHYAKTLSPNELMEPSYTVPTHDLELSLRLMEDIGWPTPTACGDADQSGTVVATDALIALNTAVGLAGCLESACDPSRNGAVTASDALAILSAAVSPGTHLRCGLTAG